MRLRLLVSLATIAASPVLKAVASPTPSMQHVMIVMFENTDYDKAMAQPFFAKIAREGALLTNLHAETHPSQGNYIALVAGDLLGVHDDRNVDLDARHIADLVEDKGKTWKIYAENYPGNCFLRTSSGDYARKHVPLLSFRNVTSNVDRCSRIVPATEFASDISRGTLPNYALYIPNQRNDGHDTGVAFADRWYAQTFGPLLTDRRFMDGMTLITTFDEGSATPDNHIYGSIYGDDIQPGSKFEKRTDHFGLLRTIEEGLSLGTLGRNDARSAPITDIWKNAN